MENYNLLLGVILITISIFFFYLVNKKHQLETFYVRDKNQTFTPSFIPLDNESSLAKIRVQITLQIIIQHFQTLLVIYYIFLQNKCIS